MPSSGAIETCDLDMRQASSGPAEMLARYATASDAPCAWLK